MQYWRSAVVTSFVFIVVIFLASCGGGHSNPIGPITSISLAPIGPISLNQGDVVSMSVTATDAKGHVVQNQTLTFNSNPPNIVQVANNGLICAGGQWEDSNHDPTKGLANPVICAGFPGATPTSLPIFNTGATSITVTAQGVTSNAVSVNVHAKVARVVLNPTNPPCVAQGAGASYTAQVFDISGNDITSQIGSFSWSVADSSIGAIGSATTTGSVNSVFASLPGSTTVTATVNGTNPVTSVGAIFQECAVGNITITGANGSTTQVFSPSPAATSTTQQLTAVVTDINGNAVNNPAPALTWNSSQPVSATVSSSGLVTAVAAGASSITASCAVNGACNKNQNSLVTSNTVVASVSGSSAAGIIVYATSSLNNNTSLVPIDTSTNTAQTAIPLPSTPNSLVFDNTGAVGYLGSDGGLMVLSPSTNSLTKTVSNAPGQVLAVSPNGGQFVIVGGKLSNGNPTATLLFNNTTNAVSTLNITNAVAADFSPDGSEAVVADATGVRTVQGTAVRNVSNTVASSVSFLANGALAYLAAGGAPSVIACNSTLHSPGVASVTPKLVKTSPDGSKILATAPANSLQVIAVAISGNACPPTIGETLTTLTFPANATVHHQIIVTSDGSHAYFPSDVVGSLLSFDGAATGSVPLSSGTAVTTTGGATLDSASVYVGVSDSGGTVGSVHQINVSAGTDAAQISVGFIPDLVAVRPH
jgi:hypothetical protein